MGGVFGSRGSARARWSVPEPDMHVARIGTRTAGYVLGHLEGFIAFDDTARPIGRCRSLRAAKGAVLAAWRGGPPPRRAGAGLFVATAVASAVVAGTLAIVGLHL